jgi:hypothetical protein
MEKNIKYMVGTTEGKVPIAIIITNSSSKNLIDIYFDNEARVRYYSLFTKYRYHAMNLSYKNQGK